VGDQGRRIKLALHPVEGHTVNPVFGVSGSPVPHPSAGGRSFIAAGRACSYLRINRRGNRSWTLAAEGWLPSRSNCKGPTRATVCSHSSR